MIRVSCSTSRLNTMQLCWKKYDYSYVHNLIPIDKQVYWERGSLVHTFFKYYYREKMNGRWKDDPSQQGIVLDEATSICRRDAVDMALSIKQTEEYIKVSRENLIHNSQDGMVVFAVEEPFSKIIYERPDTEAREGVQILYEGIVDLLASLPNTDLMVWDHKTESRKSTSTVMDNQFAGESWAFNVSAVVVNKIGMQSSLKLAEKFQRPILDFTPELIDEWKRDTIKTILEAVERHKRDSDGNGDWPRNRTSCGKFGSCVYISVCQAKPVVRPIKLQTWFKDKPEHDIYEDKKRSVEVER